MRILSIGLAFISTLAAARDIEPRVYNGTRALPGEFAEVVFIGNCTGTIIGERVIMTAGHCRSTNSIANFNHKGVSYASRCTRHPQYSNSSLNNDFALCVTSKAIEGAKLASVGCSAAVKEVITLAGYGAPNFRTLYHGNVAVERTNDKELVTYGRVVLGGGDSGGPSFKKVEDRIGQHNCLVGVNSRAGGNRSYLNRTDLERSKAFFKSVAEKHAIDICGITKDCVN